MLTPSFASSEPRRRARLVLALLHLAVVALVPLAHAEAEAATYHPESHLEREGVPCSSGHDDLTCQLCRAFHDVRGLPAGGGCAPAATHRPVPQPPLADRPTRESVIRIGGGSRAPPVPSAT